MSMYRDVTGQGVFVTPITPMPVGIPGYTTATAPATITVTTSSTSILPANATRRRLILRNQDATNPIYLSFSGAATTSGVMVPAGQVFDLQGWAGLVNGIATGAPVVVSKVEFS